MSRVVARLLEDPKRAAVAEPKKAVFYLYFYAAGALRRKREVHVVGTLRREYLLWKLCRLLGLRPSDNDAVPLAIQHVDSTIAEPAPAALNGLCVDISKTRVATAFQEVFGYGLSVDPSVHDGLIVEKSDVNAAHDAQVVRGPIEAREGHVYQRLIDNTVDGDLVEDLRPCVVGDSIAFVYRKRRPLTQRFANVNVAIDVVDAADVFTPDEVGNLVQLAKAIHLDVGELDVLRDNASNLIYVVDAANTPHSPGDACINLAGIRAMHAAASAFRRQFLVSPR